MIYTPLTMKAMTIAYNAHLGQVDKAGVPYIYHPIHLAEQMDDEISCCVALLHDVVEDTAVTMEDLSSVFPREVTEPLALLTHRKEVAYYDYVRAIKRSPTAVKVKLADLAHNSDQSRCSGAHISPETLARWEAKYKRAFEILTEEEE